MQANNQETITFDKLSLYVRNAKQLHQALQKSGYYLPSEKSNVCNIEFLFAVHSKAVYCPMQNEINGSKACYSPPPIVTLLTKLVE